MQKKKLFSLKLCSIPRSQSYSTSTFAANKKLVFFFMMNGSTADHSAIIFVLQYGIYLPRFFVCVLTLLVVEYKINKSFIFVKGEMERQYENQRGVYCDKNICIYI